MISAVRRTMRPMVSSGPVFAPVVPVLSPGRPAGRVSRPVRSSRRRFPPAAAPPVGASGPRPPPALAAGYTAA